MKNQKAWCLSQTVQDEKVKNLEKKLKLHRQDKIIERQKKKIQRRWKL